MNVIGDKYTIRFMDEVETQIFLNVIEDMIDQKIEETKKDPQYLKRLWEEYINEL